MSGREWMLLVFQVIGGMSLFIFGMHVMTQGLRAAAGETLRVILARTARSRVQGLVLGTLVGFLAHSGAATTMVAGFVNAGLMGLAESVPPMLGANVGTALSMQLISFHIGAYCWMAIGIGFILSMAAPGERARESGRALLGFGLLFLGMTTISEAIAPHKDMLAPWLAHIHGETWTGRLAGVAVSALLTALVTSSGAVIGLCFALVGAGVFTQFDQVFPIVLGSHIGTCIVALTASAAMNVEARRSALGHLVFNVFNVALALLAYPLVRAAVLWSSDSLTRQAANLHLFVMAAASLIVLPASRPAAALLRRLWPSREPPPEPSHLDVELLDKPEQALCAAIRELRRMAHLCVRCMDTNARIMLKGCRASLRRLYADEEVVNEVKKAMYRYLGHLTDRYLSRRQTLFLQHVGRCMKDLERIGDHLTAIADISIERWKHPEAMVPEPMFLVWFDLFCAAKQVLVMTEQSLNPDLDDFQGRALSILEARDRYVIMSMDAKAEFAGAAEAKTVTPLGGYYLSRYVADLDRLVRHAKSIAFAERQPDFRVKRTKLDREAKPAGAYEAPAPVKAEDYMARIQRMDWLSDSEPALPEEQKPGPGGGAG